jgi:MSHA biogenesis protein MshJ
MITKYRQKILDSMRWVDQQPVRQRLLLLVAVVAVFLTLWDAVLMRSSKIREEQAKSDTALLEKQVKALELQAEATLKKLSADPNLERRKRKAELERQLADLDSGFNERTADLIPPSEMVRVLKELLGRDSGLQLVRLESVPASALLAADEESGSEGKVDLGSGPVRLFRHGLVLEMSGDYLSVLRYVQAIEQLPWKFFWESMTYQVQQWPVGRITLKLLSLSSEEGWIGV